MPLQATSGAASYDAFGGGVPVEPVYIEQIFSTFLYTGTGSTQTITNSIDLSTKGGLTWIKSRSGTTGHRLTDTARGATKSLASETTAAEVTESTGLTSFGTTGFTIGADADYNTSAATYASWTFRKQPKFFDVVTYTGNDVVGRQISHNLGSVPGCIIIKQTNASGEDWRVYHRSLGATKYITLNLTDAAGTSSAFWNNTAPTSTVFTLSTSNGVNGTGNTYVAYLFAHDAGGFGLTGTDNVISCGSFTTSAGGAATVTLGYEPQWMLLKQSSGTAASWTIVDSMRGLVSGASTTTSDDATLNPNNSNEEGINNVGRPTATGFEYGGSVASQTFIYIAIRRGPMKVPTSGTSVFSPNAVSSSTNSWTTGFPVDMLWDGKRTTGTVYVGDRLRGNLPYLLTSSTAAEVSYSTSFYFDKPTGTMAQGLYGGTLSGIMWNFRRAPSYFDVVCYDGKTGSTQIINHNLGVSPELVIIKCRQTSTYIGWPVYASAVGTANLFLNDTSSAGTYLSNAIRSPTATTFTVDNNADVNGVGKTFVAYLFATCAGVSKVGTYTGTGTTLQVNCGFTAGARFVLIKRTDSTGDWYVWDSARGIVSGNDPYLLLNSTAAEVTSTDYVDTYSAGFELSSTAPAAINASGGTYIFLAIA